MLVSLKPREVQMFNHLDKGDTIDVTLGAGEADASASTRSCFPSVAPPSARPSALVSARCTWVPPDPGQSALPLFMGRG
jgi:hypothetical protein